MGKEKPQQCSGGVFTTVKGHEPTAGEQQQRKVRISTQERLWRHQMCQIRVLHTLAFSVAIKRRGLLWKPGVFYFDRSNY